MMSVEKSNRDMWENCASSSGYSEEWRNYVRYRSEIYGKILPEFFAENMDSETMWLRRGRAKDGTRYGVTVEAGDIVWLDYGQTFNKEMGYQHFGLIVKLCDGKALVVPITSNEEAYENAEDPAYHGSHLMRLGQPEGMRKPSTLYMNDFRWINTARILYKVSRLEPDSDQFQEIRSRMLALIMN